MIHGAVTVICRVIVIQIHVQVSTPMVKAGSATVTAVTVTTTRHHLHVCLQSHQVLAVRMMGLSYSGHGETGNRAPFGESKI